MTLTAARCGAPSDFCACRLTTKRAHWRFPPSARCAAAATGTRACARLRCCDAVQDHSAPRPAPPLDHIESAARGGGYFAFGRPARACCSSSDHDRAGEAARARHARQAPPSCAHMMPSLHVTGRISAPRYIQTFAFGAIDAPSATHGGEPLTQRIDFSTLAASAAPGLPRASVDLTSPGVASPSTEGWLSLH